MIACPDVRKDVIRSHYNLTTPFYWLLWGHHIHHGLWDGDETPQVAQQKLTETLAANARITRGSRVADIGCGMGGSSIHLARELACDVTGVTISPVQRRWANWSSWWAGTSARTGFQCIDAELVTFEPESLDVVWSVECTEHLFDKPAFFQKAAGWLKPGGRFAICAWLSGDVDGDAARRQQVYDVCEGFFCPSLGTMDDYASWMTAAGCKVERADDWTDRVVRTWEICRDRVQRTRMRPLARVIDRNTVMFLDRFETILNAYQSGAMRYGCLIAEKPS